MIPPGRNLYAEFKDAIHRLYDGMDFDQILGASDNGSLEIGDRRKLLAALERIKEGETDLQSLHYSLLEGKPDAEANPEP